MQALVNHQSRLDVHVLKVDRSSHQRETAELLRNLRDAGFSPSSNSILVLDWGTRPKVDSEARQFIISLNLSRDSIYRSLGIPVIHLIDASWNMSEDVLGMMIDTWTTRTSGGGDFRYASGTKICEKELK